MYNMKPSNVCSTYCHRCKSVAEVVTCRRAGCFHQYATEGDTSVKVSLIGPVRETTLLQHCRFSHHCKITCIINAY